MSQSTKQPTSKTTTTGKRVVVTSAVTDTAETQSERYQPTDAPEDYKPALGRNVKVSAAVQVRPSVQNGQSGTGAFMAPGLRPIARAKVFGTNQNVFVNSIGVLAYSFIADPTFTAVGAAYVQAWANRFAGFQQYRIRSTTWEVIPMRPLVGTTTSAQASGGFEIWVDDNPASPIPNNFACNDANRRFVLFNSEETHRLHYAANEPQDLNLTPIGEPPYHIAGGTAAEGQHSFKCYGDNTTTQIDAGLDNLPVAIVRPIYDIEFFGIGAN